MVEASKKENISLSILFTILLVTVIVGLGGLLFYHAQRKNLVIKAQNELSIIASFKIREIENWRNEHIKGGRLIRENLPLNKEIASFLKDKSSADRENLLKRFEIFQKVYEYIDVSLVDLKGVVRLMYPPSDSTFHFNASEFNDKDIVFSDLHYSDDLPGRIHIDMQVPLFEPEGNTQIRYGTMLLSIDPERTLYPLIQSWPTPSKTAETLIFRREGDSVLFLNELRHLKNTALRFKLPISKQLPAARAVLGQEGLFEGVDYRGIPVVAYLKKIPELSWYMVAKVDKKEIYSPLNYLLASVLTVMFLLVVMVSLLVVYLNKNKYIRSLKELNSTKDKFFSIISHDLRSPFTSILGFADILLQNENLTKSEIKSYAEIISSSSQNAVDLLKSLTEWSALQTNKIKFNPEEIDLVSIINREIKIMTGAAIQKSLIISKDIPLEMNLYADPNMISMVFRNLLSNAIKYSYPGGKIHVSALKKPDEVSISVCDFGTGITKENLNKIFKMKEHITTPGTLKEPGTGLGLILVKEFISLHGGQVYVESELNKYSKFTFTLPLTRNET